MPSNSDLPPAPSSHSESRWKWMAWSSAAVGAAAPASISAGQVQIDLASSVATFHNGVLTDQIKRDMTGDGVTDLENLMVNGASSANFFRNFVANTGTFLLVGSRRYVSTAFSSGYFTGYDFGFAAYISRQFTTSIVESFRASVGFGVTSNYYSAVGQGKTNQDVDAVVPVTFRDARINGGAETDGFVHCRAFNLARNSHRVEMLRLIFNDSSVDFGNPLIEKTTTYPTWTPSLAADGGNALAISKLKKKIKKLKAKQKKLKKAGNATAATKLGKKIKKLKKKLKAL